MSAAKPSASSIEFGRFKVVPHRRELLAEGHPVQLRGRLFDLLMALIEARGTVVSKNDLMNRVWPGRVVEENNLTVGIAALRKALGADRDLIRTVSGSGYQFVAEVREVAAVRTADHRTNLPAPTSALVGREAALAQVCTLVMEKRLLTLTGAGGIGKTRLAMEAARGLLPHFPQGVWIVDLAPLSDADLVPASVAIALGLNVSDITSEQIARALGTRHTLVVLDNCEHVINVAARTANQLVRAGPQVHALCTSREPLRTEDEWIYQVQPLDVPGEDATKEEDVLTSSAAKLFVARASAAQPLFRLEPSVTARLGLVCRRLDGMPLAIELAAARAAVLGVQEVATRLDERFRLLTGGRRTALPRHQTLRATLDWSYELLPESERVTLCRLGVFAGEFTLDAATAVLSDAEGVPDDVAEHVGALVEKSLASVSSFGGIARYRMLETTRAYAREKLAERGKLQQYARQHAQYHLTVFKRASAEWSSASLSDWSSDYCRLLEDGRVALDWAFSSTGDPTMAAELTIALAPIWMRLSLNTEWCNRVRQALRATTLGSHEEPRNEMKLNAALGMVLGTAHDQLAPPSSTVELEGKTACAKALVIAEQLGDFEYQLVSLYGLYFWASATLSPYREALSLAERYSRVAQVHADPSAQARGDVLIADAFLKMGDLDGCVRSMRAARRRDIRRGRGLPMVVQDEGWDVILAFALWLQGFPDKSFRIVSAVLEEGITLDNASVICFRALFAFSIAMLIGDLATAEHYVTLAFDHARKLRSYRTDMWVSGLEAALLTKSGDFDRGLPGLRAALVNNYVGAVYTRGQLTCILAQGLGDTGQVLEGLSVIEEALRESEVTEVRWFVAEYWRIKGDLLLLGNVPDASAEAERCYSQSIEWARQQGALSWELRAAISLARLRKQQGRAAEATQTLRSVYCRFKEGSDTADLLTARKVLEDLHPRPSSAPGDASVP
jgi:predicted ATPase/DNA-binding winged helix-turn-helix (wHTH) protein